MDATPSILQLVERIYVTTPQERSQDEHPSPPEQVRPFTSQQQQQQVMPVDQRTGTLDRKDLAVVTTHPTGRRTHEPVVLAALASRGWRFPPVALATVDEQLLFEFEVTLRLRTSVTDIVGCCQRFRTDLLRSFPAHVFLQRPTVVQYLLYLVQQPLLGASNATAAADTTADTDALERALQLSFGVNYFDDLDAPSFSPKPSSLATAVFVAAVRALEAFMYALQRSAAISLSPALLVYPSSVSLSSSSLAVGAVGVYDTRRVLYPRAMPDDSTVRPSDSSGSQYSLGGAVHGLFTSLLPLLASPTHPRLHLLNVVHVALPLLCERSAVGTTDDAVRALDAARIEQLLALLGDFCFPDTTAPARDLSAVVREFSCSVTRRLLELVLRLLQLHPPSLYQVSPVVSVAGVVDIHTSLGGGDEPPTGVRIHVPDRVWRFVMLCASSAEFADVAKSEWKIDNVVGFLSEIDSSVASFLGSRRAMQATRDEVADFLELARQPARVDDASRLRLNAARTVALALPGLSVHDVPVAVDGILRAAFGTTSSQHAIEEGDATLVRESVVAIVSAGVRNTSESSRLALSHLLRELSRVLSDVPRRALVVRILSDAQLLGLLLLRAGTLTESGDHEHVLDTDALWTVLAAVITELCRGPEHALECVTPVIPLLQHFAFLEPSERVASGLRDTQPMIVELVNRVEQRLVFAEQLLLITRCLLHASPYIRKAAASGVLSTLSETNPTAFRRIAESMSGGTEVVVDDPFGAATTTAGGRELEKRLREVSLPSLPTTDSIAFLLSRTAKTTVSPSLAKLSALRKVLSSASARMPSVKETAVRELLLLLDDLPAAHFRLLEELDEVAHVTQLLLANLQGNDDGTSLTSPRPSNSEAFTEVVLVLLRNLLQRSPRLRRAMRRDTDALAVLTPLVFDARVAVRAQMYYIVLLLTLTHESVVASLRADTGAPHQSHERSVVSVDAVPDLVLATFGLHSQSWSRCGVTTCSVEALLEDAEEKPSSTVFESIAHGGRQDDDTSDTRAATLSFTASAVDVDFVLQRVRTAKSHARFLNALYQLVQLAEASDNARARIASHWESLFERYTTVAPVGARDEVVVGAVLSCLNSLVDGTSRESQLRLLLVVKRAFIPLLKRTVSAGFAAQVLRLLAHLSVSNVADLFPTLAFDTDLLDVLCSKYASLYSAQPVLHALTLDVVLRFATVAKRQNDNEDNDGDNDDSAASRVYNDAIHQRLLSLVSPLLAIVCRHRVPGSFIDRDVFALAAQTLLGIVSATPHKRLLGDATSVLVRDHDLLVDNAWSSRLLFDHTSPLRALGFSVLAATVARTPADVESRLLQLAVDTSMDGTECDAVRGAACSVVFEALVRFEAVGDSRRAQLTNMLGGDTFAPSVLRALSKSRDDDQLLVNCSVSLCRLFRLLLAKRSVFTEHLGDPALALAAADQSFDVYTALVQVSACFTWLSFVVCRLARRL